jgi:hypothetical protein
MGGHCASACLRDLLEHHRLSYADAPPREGMAFGLASGLGFGFGELPGLVPPLLVTGRPVDLEHWFCRNLGLEYELRQTDDRDEARELLRAEVQGGRPTMIWTDMKQLGYLNVRMHNTHHTVVVVDWDEDGDAAWVVDNDREEPQRVPLAALAEARDADVPPYGPNRNGTWLIDFPAALPDLERTTATALRRAVANMRAPDDPRLGLAGVLAFGRAYPTWGERSGDDLEAMMKGLRVFVVKAGTGGALFRGLHRDFLRDAAGMLGDDDLRAAADLYAELAEAWERLAAPLDDEPAADAHRARMPLVERIVRLEEAGVAAIEAWTGARVSA